MKTLSIPNTRSTWWLAVRRWAARYKLWLGGAAIVALGLALGWNSLAAAGVLPLLFAMLPCTLMLAVCMKGMGGSKGKQTAESSDPAQSAHTVTPASLPDSSSTHIEEKDHA